MLTSLHGLFASPHPQGAEANSKDAATIYREPARPRGAALFLTLAFAAMIAVFVLAMMEAVMSENMSTDSMVLDAQARYLAESGAEYAIQQLKSNIANGLPLAAGANVQVLPRASAGEAYLPGYDGTTAGVPVVMWKAIRIQASGTQSTGVGGVTQTDQLYAVTSRAVVKDPEDPSRRGVAYVSKLLDMNMVPLCQYLAFYSAFDLEMLPASTATLQGRIHCNGNIWIGAGPGRTMAINTNAMTAAGTIQRQRKDVPPSASNHYMTGTVQIKVAAPVVADNAPVNSTNYPPMEARGALKTAAGVTVPTSAAPSGYDSNFNGYDANSDGNFTAPNDLKPFASGSQDRWQGSVQTGAQGVPTLAAPTDISAYRAPVSGETPSYRFDSWSKTWVPATGSAATSVPGHYLQDASLVLSSNGRTTKLTDSSGNLLLQLDRFWDNMWFVAANNLKDSNGAPINPISETAMFDTREYDPATDTTTSQPGYFSPGMVKVTQIDLDKLNQSYYNNNPIFPTTGPGSVIFAYRTDTTTVNPNGIRLANGAELNNNLTFVSEDPVYVKGDFNTTNEKAAIILADAVTLLSNQWDDSMTSTSDLKVPASDLNVNAALMAGSYATQAPDANGNGGLYNGGFENLPRFLEDWSASGKAINILGSFACLFTSKFAQGPWVYGGNHYTAPVRNWNFDTKFLQANFQPPDSPVSVGETRVAFWRGRYLAWWPIADYSD